MKRREKNLLLQLVSIFITQWWNLSRRCIGLYLFFFLPFGILYSLPALTLTFSTAEIIFGWAIFTWFSFAVIFVYSAIGSVFYLIMKLAIYLLTLPPVKKTENTKEVQGEGKKKEKDIPDIIITSTFTLPFIFSFLFFLKKWLKRIGADVWEFTLTDFPPFLFVALLLLGFSFLSLFRSVRSLCFTLGDKIRSFIDTRTEWISSKPVKLLLLIYMVVQGVLTYNNQVKWEDAGGINREKAEKLIESIIKQRRKVLREREEKYPDIILITADSLSAENISLYGYHRETTPLLQKLISAEKRRCKVFANFYANSNWTPPGISAILTGKLPRVFSFSERTEEKTTLPGELKAKGYITIAIWENRIHPGIWGVEEDFDLFISSSDITKLRKNKENRNLFSLLLIYPFLTLKKIVIFPKNGVIDWIMTNVLGQIFPENPLRVLTSSPLFPTSSAQDTLHVAEELLRAIKIWREKNEKNLENNVDTSPFFLWIHIFPPHAPYLPSPKFKGKFLKNLKWGEKIDRIIRYAGSSYQLPKSERGKHTFPLVLELLEMRYNEFISEIDSEIFKFIEFLKWLGLWERTAVIISSDHGETFDGRWGHGGMYMYQPLIRIPFIVCLPPSELYPLSEDKIFVSAPASQVDIPPTILEIADIYKREQEKAESQRKFDGKSLLQYIYCDSVPPGRNSCPQDKQREVFSISVGRGIPDVVRGQKPGGSYPPEVIIYKMRKEKIRWVSIAVIRARWKLIRYISPEGEIKEELYNLEADPKEKNNLISQKKEIASQLRKKLCDGFPFACSQEEILNSEKF